MIGLIRRISQIGILTATLLLFAGLSAAEVYGAVETPPGVTFPIGELGGCKDYKTCLVYCDDPVNHTACVDYAKKKGFYKQDDVVAPSDEFWAKAKAALGCDSKEACETFCSQPGSFATCDAFAKSEALIGGYVDTPDKPEYLSVAKEILGCDSAGTCAATCDNPVNRARCEEFANRVGLLGGGVNVGPGGCNSDTTCESFCRDPNNFDQCRSHAQTVNQDFRGPGGCNTPESCRSHCEQNPAECRSYAPGSSGNYVTIACPSNQYHGPGGVCTPTEKTQEAVGCSAGKKHWNGSSCQDTPPSGVYPGAGGFFQPREDLGGCTTPGTCYDFCQVNPGKCPGFTPSGPRPPDSYVPTIYYTPGTGVKFEPITEMGGCASPGGCYDYCKENPGKCSGFDPNSPRPLNNYVPGTYYTPPKDFVYPTPPETSFYVTPLYYTPPPGSNYTTPTYYTPGTYFTPPYYTPPPGSNYTTPTYYTPGAPYITPNHQYTTPTYLTPTYYTPPPGSNYTTPTYYTPPPYITPTYYTPPPGSGYTTPTYSTPPPYTTPTYYTPWDGGKDYATPTYYTPPPGYTTPTYVTPGYYTPYVTPNYYYPTPGTTYPTPEYHTPYSYPTPGSGYTYPTPVSYTYPTPGGTYYTPGGGYTTPPPYSTPSYAYPTPGSYYYPTPGGTGYTTPTGTYSTPSYYYPTPGSYSYPTPGSYSTPSYPTPSDSYPTPPPYGTPEYSTPPPYGTPSYGTPPPYGTPTMGVSTERPWWEVVLNFILGR